MQWGLPMVLAAFLRGAPAPEDNLFAYVNIHLLIVQTATLLLVAELSRLLETPWFPALKRNWLASTASLVALATGFSALLTMATSAAARYDVSLQFLQLLSSLDIAWVTATTFIALGFLRGRAAAWLGGIVILIACVASIAIYLDVVGFTNSGGWLVDGSKLMSIVLPADTIAALIALSILAAASRGVQSTAQPRPQS